MRGIWGIAFMSICAGAAHADSDYVNTCDVEKPAGCYDLAQQYAAGTAPFPVDRKRAEELFGMAETGAQKMCDMGELEGCEILLDIVSDVNELLPLSQDARMPG